MRDEHHTDRKCYCFDCERTRSRLSPTERKLDDLAWQIEDGLWSDEVQIAALILAEPGRTKIDVMRELRDSMPLGLVEAAAIVNAAERIANECVRSHPAK